MVVEDGRGTVFIDCSRVVSPAARLSVELEGAPDLVVEVLSDSSVSKDRLRLPELYARAGVAELWLVDARGETPALEIRTLRPAGGYSRVPADEDGPDAWTPSPLLGCRFRLRRHEMEDPLFVNHKLEVAP